MMEPQFFDPGIYLISMLNSKSYVQSLIVTNPEKNQHLIWKVTEATEWAVGTYLDPTGEDIQT